MQLRIRQFRLIDDGIGRIEFRVLIEQSDLQRFGNPHRPPLRRHFVQNNFEKRAFARPVRPDQPYPLAPLQSELQPIKQHSRAKTFFDIRQSH